MTRKITNHLALDALVGTDNSIVTIVLTRSGNVYVESAVVVGVYSDGRFDVVYDDDGKTIEDQFDLAFYHVLVG
jgi:hypothetical protein